MRRAARTLCYYLSETNLNVHHWLMSYMQKNPIPRVTLNPESIFRSCFLLAARLHEYFLPGPLTWPMSTLQSGGWDDVSGETFLRNLLSMPLEHAKWNTVSSLMFTVYIFLIQKNTHHTLHLCLLLYLVKLLRGGCICTKLVKYVSRRYVGSDCD